MSYQPIRNKTSSKASTPYTTSHDRRTQSNSGWNEKAHAFVDKKMALLDDIHAAMKQALKESNFEKYDQLELRALSAEGQVERQILNFEAKAIRSCTEGNCLDPDEVFFRENAPSYGEMHQVFQNTKDIGDAVLKIRSKLDQKCTDIIENIYELENKCGVFDTALRWCETGPECNQGENALIISMHPISNFFHVGCRYLFEKTEREEVYFDANVTDNSFKIKTPVSNSIAKPKKQENGANKSDCLIGFRKFPLLRIEAKWDRSNSDSGHEQKLKEAEAQLQKTAYWLLSVCNKAPFYFAMTYANKGGKLFLVGPHQEQIAVRFVTDFSFEGKENRESFLRMILALIRLNRTVISFIPRRKEWAPLNVDTTEDGKFSEHRTSQLLGEASGKCTVRVFEDKVVKYCLVEYTSGRDVLEAFYEKLEALSPRSRPKSLPSEIAVQFLPNPNREIAVVTSKPVAFQPEDPSSYTDCKALAGDVLSALKCIHEMGYVHRDVRGPNILQQTSGSWMLIDFEYVCKIGNHGKAEKIPGTYDVNDLPNRLRKLQDGDVSSGQSDDYWCVKDDLEQLGTYLLHLCCKELCEFAKCLIEGKYETAQDALKSLDEMKK